MPLNKKKLKCLLEKYNELYLSQTLERASSPVNHPVYLRKEGNVKSS